MKMYAFDFLSRVELVIDADTHFVLGSSSMMTLFFDLLLDDDLPTARVPHVDVYRCRVGAVAKTALEGCGLYGGVGILVDGGFPDPAVGVPEVELRVVVGPYLAGRRRLVRVVCFFVCFVRSFGGNGLFMENIHSHKSMTMGASTK